MWPCRAEKDVTDAKRKFLTFIEEIALLVNSELLKPDVAYYMFGYYAVKAHRGSNFHFDVNYSPAYWGLFMSFAERAERYLASPGATSAPELSL